MLQNSSSKSLVFHVILFSLIGSVFTGTIILLLSFLVPNHTENLWVLRLSILLQDTFVMFLPAYLVFKLSSHKPLYALKLTKDNKMKDMLFRTFVIFLVTLPAASVMAQWNAGIMFPEALSGLEAKFREMEESAKAVTDTFLASNNLLDLLINVAIVGVAAAFVEEVLFRGALQQLFEKWFNNGHAAVWVTAFIFSAIHLQFYGFVPRLFMGAVLGYLFLYSRNLWVPIFYHFINNASVVIMSYFGGDSNIMKRMEESSLEWYSWIGLAISLILTYFLFSRFSREVKH